MDHLLGDRFDIGRDMPRDARRHKANHLRGVTQPLVCRWRRSTFHGVNPVLGFAYESAGLVLRAAGTFMPAGEGKLVRALRARRGIRSRYTTWGARERDPQRLLLWIHAPSVGEGLQARPVLIKLRSARPELQLAYTFFSPSAEAFARSLDVDFRDYLPFDTTGDVRAALSALQPRALVFSKLDVWPTLVREAAVRSVRLGLISGTVAATSGRRSAAATALLRDAYAHLDAVGAIDEEDAARLVELGVRPDVVTVTGDTRYDQVWARAERAGQAEPGRQMLLASIASDRPTVVAGSTWPADERALLAIWPALRSHHPGLRLIIAPHEPTPAHLEPIERWAAAAGVRLTRLSHPDAARADVILVDHVGVLGDLYALADIAFVGGGFHDAGLHSVLEPAAFGVPTLFGPNHRGSRDARLLMDAGGGAAVSSARELQDRLEQWLALPDERRHAGDRARALVRDGLGAADRSVALVERLLAG